MGSGSQQKSEKLRSKPPFSEMENFHAQYEMLGTIGHGGSTKVKLARHRLTGTHVAVKMIPKREYWCKPLMSEAELLMMADHPNIISLLQVIETKKKVYLIMELCEGKSLYQHIRNAGYLQEDEARALFKQLLSAINYCRNQGIVHRDLKPDNIMVEKDGRVKIIDFGLGIQVKPGQKLNLFCGTYPFSAPEVLLSRPYDGPKIDVWTLGVVLYFMVTGKIPFDAASIEKLRKQIVAGKYSVPCRLSVKLHHLITLLMTDNPELRPTVAEVMMHPWVTKGSGVFPDPCEEQIPLKPDPAIVKAMGHIGFQAQDIEDSLRQRKFNETMASYCLLKKQLLKECDRPIRAQPMNPSVTPFPSLVDTPTFHLGLRRRETEPTSLRLSANRQMSVCGRSTSKKRDRSFSWPGVLSRPINITPTMDQTHTCTRSVPCINSNFCIIHPNSSDESTEGHTSASAEDKPVRSRGWPRGIKGWTSKIGNAMRKLCCCIPSNETSHLGQRRVSPKK
uniref:Sperm motility kinase 2A n=1 Tax=Mus musculus TaxID=10090 RepID=SMK2A_MOUSE